MIKPSDAIKDPGIDAFFKKAEKDAEKELNKKALKDYINYIFDHHVDTDSVLKEVEKWKKRDEWEEFMNKPTTPIKIFYSQPMHDKTEDEIEDKIDRLDNYIYGALMYAGFKQEDIIRIEIIDNLHHEGLDPDAGRLRHLGASIQLMEDADLVIFNENYFVSEGCCVEEEVCKEYEIPHIYIADKDDENAFENDLISWFKKYLDNENVSK